MDAGVLRARGPVERQRGQLLTSIAFALLFVFVFSIPLENALVLPGIGTIGRLVGLAAFALGILAIVETGKVRSPSPVHLLMLAFVVWASLSYFWTVSPDDTVEEVLSYVQLLAMVWLVWELAPLPRQRVLLVRKMRQQILSQSVAKLPPLSRLRCPSSTGQWPYGLLLGHDSGLLLRHTNPRMQTYPASKLGEPLHPESHRELPGRS